MKTHAAKRSSKHVVKSLRYEPDHLTVNFMYGKTREFFLKLGIRDRRDLVKKYMKYLIRRFYSSIFKTKYSKYNLLHWYKLYLFGIVTQHVGREERNADEQVESE